MKRALSFGYLVFLIFAFADLSALYQDVTFRVGSYFPSYHKTRRIFAHGPAMGQIETSFHFAQPWEYMPWQAWVNIGYTAQGKHVSKVSNSHFIPISAGLKYTWCVGDGGELALGIGAAHSWLRIKDESVFPRRYVVKHDWGGVLKSSLRYWFAEDFFGELFLDYLITYFHYKGREGQESKVPHRLDMNGVLLGGGVGFAF